MSFNSREFRNCLGSFATGVSVISAYNQEKEPCGVTVNSFSSVSLSPPLILFCLGKDTYHHDSFINTDYFGVNILSERQRSISQAFARSIAQPWDEVSYKNSTYGSPCFKDNHGFMECERYAVYDGGDHSIILGKVLHLETGKSDFPLLYYQGKYHNIGHSIKEDI